MSEELPRHRHHGEGFTFLGRFGNYDLYWAPGPSLVARFGDINYEYSNGIAFGWTEGERLCSPLVEARKRAEARGLDVAREVYAKETS